MSNEDAADKLDKLSAEDITKRYKLNVLRKLQEGKVGLTTDIDYLKREERKQRTESLDKDGYAEIPARNRVRRHYTVTDEALKQRRDATRRPKPGMKGNKNAWKHGRHVADFIQSRLRPCLSTCKDYPCALVVTNKTKAGAICLDKQSVVSLYYDLKKAQEDKKGIGEIAHLMLAEVIHMVKTIMDDIMTDGNLIAEDRVDKDGTVIAKSFKPHPLYSTLEKLMPSLGLTLNDFMLTPAAVEKAKLKDKENETMAAFTSRLLKSIGDNKTEGGQND